MKKTTNAIMVIQLCIVLTLSACWITNLVQFFKCDFQSPYKKEIIKGVGVIIPPTSIVTVWF